MDLSYAAPSSADGPTRLGIHSVEGWGKTTFLAHMPRPLIIGAERGIPRDLGFAVDTIQPRTWLDVFDIVGDLTDKDHDYLTLGIDTFDWLEPLIHRFVCERDSKRKTEMNPKGNELLSIEDYGWGKGFTVAEEEVRKLINVLDVMQYKRGIHVCILMHSKVGSFKNPSGADFDRWEPKCHSRIARVLVEYVEHLLFGYFQVDASKITADVDRNAKTARAKGIGSGIRMIGTRQNAMYDAKNRVRLDPEMEYTNPADLIPHILGKLVTRDDPMPRYQDDSSAHVAPARRDEQSARYPRPSQDEAPRETEDETRARVRADQDRVMEAAARTTGPTQEAGRERARAMAAENQALAEDDKKRNAREWTEPKREQTKGAPDPKTSAAPAGRDVSKETRALMDALEHATAKGGELYRKKVDGWVTKAKGDPAKIDSIIKQIYKDLP